MTTYVYHLIDQNTGEEVDASEDFRFVAPPVPEHRIHDAALVERYGGPAIVDRVEESRSGDTVDVRVYIDGVEERVNGDERDENYRRS